MIREQREDRRVGQERKGESGTESGAEMEKQCGDRRVVSSVSGNR